MLGGPAMLIGLGGGAASSKASGPSAEDLDFASVQRSNPELQRRCQEVFDRCVGYARSLVPALVERVRLYDGAVPLFESLGIEKDIEKALRRRVWLRSGRRYALTRREFGQQVSAAPHEQSTGACRGCRAYATPGDLKACRIPGRRRRRKQRESSSWRPPGSWKDPGERQGSIWVVVGH